ncbi:efflux RND transporter permease subunit [Leucobacter sp. UCMA 4100]|uniref:efflux RND transporter permease subunit n=1 Tax=Leucobacter sp. UCMA 4100 TaxID=2810534 RepID=UPI003FA5F116
MQIVHFFSGNGDAYAKLLFMHLLAKVSLKNRALIALVTIVACLFGVISMSGLKQELMPQVQFPAIAVVTSYPGASPEVVNNDVSVPIEEAVSGVASLERSSSTSSTSASMVLLEFTYGTDIAATEQKVERAISRISQSLPQDVEPQVVSGSIDDFPVIQIAVGAADGQDIESLTNSLETVAVPELEDVDGIRQVRLGGVTGQRVTITPDEAKLAEKGYTNESIQSALKQNDVLLPAGQITEGENTLSVQVGGDVDTVDALAALPLVPTPEQFMPQQPEVGAAGADGLDAAGLDASQLDAAAAAEQAAPPVPTAPEYVTIGDVAEVTLESNPVSSISRINGEPAVSVSITKLAAANTVEVSHAVQDLLPKIEKALDGAELTVVFDQAPYIEQSVETLAVEGMLGLVFAILVILVFLLSVRATLVTAVSIPTSLLLTFIGLNFADYTLNMLTLGALTISIGRVVDDSIVVIENIKRHLREGEPRASAIVFAVREVAGAITASTVTTIAVFLPMAFVSGMVGEMFRPFAFTMTFALAASLLVSLTIVPVLAYWFLKAEPQTTPEDETPERPELEAQQELEAQPELSELQEAVLTGPTSSADESPKGKRRASRLGDGTAVTKLQRVYLPVIDWTLKKPVITLLAAVVVFAGTLATYPLMKQNFMGDDEQNAVSLTQTLAPGVSLDQQLVHVEEVEGVLEEVSEIETVQVTVGSSDPAMAMFGGGGDGAVSYSLTIDPDAQQQAVHTKIREKLDTLEDAGEFSLSSASGGMGSVSTVDITVTAPAQDQLNDGVTEVVDRLRANDAFVQVESNLGTSRPMIQVTVDREVAAQAGLSEVAVASIVSSAMQPTAVGQVVLDDSSVQVYLAPGETPATSDEIEALKVPTVLGEKTLGDLAAVEHVDGPVSISTEKGVRSATISATPESDDLTVAAQAVHEELDAIELPGGVTASVGGVLAEQEKAFEQLGLALLAAILIVYVVMVATFKSLLQPLLLLVSVPFAATGAILLLVATGIPLGVASLIGVLMLVGIVVTNAIVLIDLVNQLRERGMALRDAVRTGAAHRFRPIVMTALATILALTPMGIGLTGKGGFISQPLAVVVIGGLLSSTVLTLVVLPTLYYVVERARERSRERKAAKRALKAHAVKTPNEVA